MDMRVAGVNNAYGVYSTSKTNGGKKADGGLKSDSTKDSILLSESAEDYQSVRNALMNVPDYRADLVAKFKARVDSGNYNVPASDVADKILQGI